MFDDQVNQLQKYSKFRTFDKYSTESNRFSRQLHECPLPVPGPPGPPGDNAPDGEQGDTGVDGASGIDAYQLLLEEAQVNL